MEKIKKRKNSSIPDEENFSLLLCKRIGEYRGCTINPFVSKYTPGGTLLNC